MTRAVLWDTSAILAFLDDDDANHEEAGRLAEGLAGWRAIVTNYIETEAHAALLSRIGRRSARDWLFSGAFEVLRANTAEESHAKEIIAQYDDKDWSLCDAISFAFMEMRRPAAAFSFDRHFRQYGRFRVLGR
jgi:predicted nucleic acid-binding protein